MNFNFLGQVFQYYLFGLKACQLRFASPLLTLQQQLLILQRPLHRGHHRHREIDNLMFGQLGVVLLGKIWGKWLERNNHRIQGQIGELLGV